MTDSICFKCGAEKQSPLITCSACGETPRHESALALSLVLSEHLSTKAQLTHFAHEIRNHLRLSATSAKLAEAREALKDPQLMAMLSGASAAAAPASPSARSPHRQAVAPSTSPAPASVGSMKPMKTSTLHGNPFALLGVSSRDDRRKIVEQAEHMSLELNHDDCQKARSDLTNPRNRLGAEIAWLPGVSPRKASQLLEILLSDPQSVRRESGIPPLARCNLLAAAFEAVAADAPAEDLAAFIQETAHAVDELDADAVLRDINEDRSVSGFPEVKSVELIEAELADRRRAYKNAIKGALNRLPSVTLLSALTEAVHGATGGGDDHAPELIDELVDSYAVEVQGVLEKEAETVQKLLRAARDSVGAGEASVLPFIEKIERVVRNYDRFAQPIQLSAKARGIDHDPSRDLAFSIRSLAIDLFNDHGMLALSQRLTGLLQELFAELPDVSERVTEDARALAEIQEKRCQSEALAKVREQEWARNITYSADVGLVFKDSLSISPAGIEWKGQRYPLESITAVRWGAVRHSVNGIPAGTEYQIAFASRSGSTVINLKKEATYTGFINALWRAVCVRLMIEKCEALKEGNSLNFGELTVEDGSVTLVRHKLLGANERVRMSWSDVQVWSENGEFFVGSKSDKKVYGSASYMNHWNTHLLDHVVRGGFKKGVSRLSDFFSD